MFQKPFRTKNAVTVRNSDRRKLKTRLGNFFPNLTDEQSNQIVPQKGDFKESKIFTHKGDQIIVYQLDDEPVLIQTMAGTLVPYLYSIWKFEINFSTLHTTSDVLRRFAGGADFMAPGIIIPPSGLDSTIQRQKAVMIKIAGAKWPIAVGIAEQSCSDLASGLKGKAVKIISVVGDTLWSAGSKFIPPEEADPDFTPDPVLMENFEKLLSSEAATDETGENVEEESEPGNVENPEEPVAESDPVETPEAKTIEEIRNEQDNILNIAFKAAIKIKLQPVKEKILPILCSTFYSQYLLGCVPPGEELHIKKTSYKKLSVYFAEKSAEGVLKIENAAKGVEQIGSVDFKHKFFRGFRDDIPDEEVEPEERPMVEVLGASSNKGSYNAPVITQLYTVSGQVQELFVQAGCRRNAVLHVGEIREYVTKYVTENELKYRSQVRLDPQLHRAVYGKGNEEKEFATWDKIFGAVQAKMSPAYSIQFAGQSQPIIKKGKLPKMAINIKKVSGNKSVTLVTGFEGFMIEPDYFAELMRKKAQASTSIGNDITGKVVQVLIQGNQTKHVESILTGSFCIDKKYITGLENAKTTKKGKKK